ncbi:ly6/PLAUR domain-containing protein 1 isoform X1 [Saimiri boliviensis]|nr:ly6/PLAUR domain-containing protein 1 isoform X1 [Saimiri boliviensis boliviensis]
MVPAFPARRPPPPPQLGSRHVVPGVGGGEKRRDFCGCSGSPVVPSVSATNSGGAALGPGARAGGAETRSPEPERGRCRSREQHLRLLSAQTVGSAAAARAPAASAATAAVARAASAAVAFSDAPVRSRPRDSGRMWVLGTAATFCGLFLLPGLALQIQCYQCEEFQLNNDCSSPEFIVNCTVNVQDMCQKEVMEQSAGIMYRKSCASSAACLIASAGYQSFCSPGKLNSVCISCCNTPLCNGPRPKKRGSSASALRPRLPTTILLLKLALFSAHC